MDCNVFGRSLNTPALYFVWAGGPDLGR